MPQQAWSEKRERQYEHIKEGLREQGRSEETAEEIAARTVNKERARAGEARTASRASVDDLSSGRRGWVAIPLRARRPDLSTALRRGEGSGDRRTFEDVEGATRARARASLTDDEHMAGGSATETERWTDDRRDRATIRECPPRAGARAPAAATAGAGVRPGPPQPGPRAGTAARPAALSPCRSPNPTRPPLRRREV